MLGRDGLRLDLPVVQGLLGQDQLLDVLVVHDDKFHHLAQDCLLQ